MRTSTPSGPQALRTVFAMYTASVPNSRCRSPTPDATAIVRSEPAIWRASSRTDRASLRLCETSTRLTTCHNLSGEALGLETRWIASLFAAQPRPMTSRRLAPAPVAEANWKWLRDPDAQYFFPPDNWLGPSALLADEWPRQRPLPSRLQCAQLR